MKFKQYLPHAISEIFLIVVGVLIAISVNNFNDARKNKAQLKTILTNIAVDLESDLETIEGIVPQYEYLDSIIVLITEDHFPSAYFDTIDVRNYQDCLPCNAYHIGFFSFSPKLDGYEQLRSFNFDDLSLENELIHEVSFFYKEYIKDIRIIDQGLVETTLKNIESLQVYDWYADYMLGKYNSKSIIYFQTDQNYKNRLVTFSLLAIESHLRVLKMYRKEATDLLAKLKT